MEGRCHELLLIRGRLFWRLQHGRGEGGNKDNPDSNRTEVPTEDSFAEGLEAWNPAVECEDGGEAT